MPLLAAQQKELLGRCCRQGVHARGLSGRAHWELFLGVSEYLDMAAPCAPVTTFPLKLPLRMPSRMRGVQYRMPSAGMHVHISMRINTFHAVESCCSHLPEPWVPCLQNVLCLTEMQHIVSSSHVPGRHQCPKAIVHGSAQ